MISLVDATDYVQFAVTGKIVSSVLSEIIPLVDPSKARPAIRSNCCWADVDVPVLEMHQT